MVRTGVISTLCVAFLVMACVDRGVPERRAAVRLNSAPRMGVPPPPTLRPTTGEMLAACLSGPWQYVSPNDCLALDCTDGDVDLADYARLQAWNTANLSVLAFGAEVT